MVSTRRTKRSSLGLPIKASEDVEKMDTGVAPKGGIQKNKSNRWWKKTQMTPHSAMSKVKPLHTKWKVKMKQKADAQHVKAQQTAIRESLKAERQEKADRIKANQERRQANIAKNEVVQVIKNTEKIKRLNKKQLRLIKKADTTKLLQKLK